MSTLLQTPRHIEAEENFEAKKWTLKLLEMNEVMSGDVDKWLSVRARALRAYLELRPNHVSAMRKLELTLDRMRIIK